MPSTPAAHPVARGERGRNAFDRASEAVSNITSSGWFFAVCGLLIAAWAGSYLFAGEDTLRHLLGESMAAVTLLLVALFKNADRRAEAAVQLKLDAIAEAILQQEHGQSPDDELEDAVGLHDEL